MTTSLKNLEKVTDYAVNVLRVIKDIFKSYLADDSSDDIYDKKELFNFLKKLTPKATLNLKHDYQNAVKLYGQPLPIRPHFTTLFHAQFELILQLKEQYLDIVKKHLRETTEALFLSAISAVFSKKPFDIKKINLELIDEYFEELEIDLRKSFMRIVKRELDEVERAKYPTPILIGPQRFENSIDIDPDLPSDDNEEELYNIGVESRDTSTPFSFFPASSSTPARSSTTTTNKMFPTPTNDKVNIETVNNVKFITVCDSDDSDKEFEEVLYGSDDGIEIFYEPDSEEIKQMIYGSTSMNL